MTIVGGVEGIRPKEVRRGKDCAKTIALPACHWVTTRSPALVNDQLDSRNRFAATGEVTNQLIWTFRQWMDRAEKRVIVVTVLNVSQQRDDA